MQTNNHTLLNKFKIKIDVSHNQMKSVIWGKTVCDKGWNQRNQNNSMVRNCISETHLYGVFVRLNILRNSL